MAAFNALVVPLAIEKQAYIAPRSQSIFEYEPELAAVVSAGAAAERNIYYLEKEQLQKAAALKKAGKNDSDGTTTSSKFSNIRFDTEKLLSLVPCVAAQNCTGPLTTEILAALRYRQKSSGGGGAWLGETLSSYFAPYVSSLSGEERRQSGGEDDDVSNNNFAGPLLVPTHWAIQLISDLDDANTSKQSKLETAAVGNRAKGGKKHENLEIDPERLATILFDLNSEGETVSGSASSAEVSSSSYFSSNSGEVGEKDVDDATQQPASSSLLQTGMDAIDSVLAAASAATLGHYKLEFSSKH